jgi:hypothetical protein
MDMVVLPLGKVVVQQRPKQGQEQHPGCQRSKRLPGQLSHQKIIPERRCPH